MKFPTTCRFIQSIKTYACMYKLMEKGKIKKKLELFACMCMLCVLRGFFLMYKTFTILNPKHNQMCVNN